MTNEQRYSRDGPILVLVVACSLMRVDQLANAFPIFLHKPLFPLKVRTKRVSEEMRAKHARQVLKVAEMHIETTNSFSLLHAHGWPV